MAKRPRSGEKGTPGRKADGVPAGRSAFKRELASRLKSAREDAGLSQVEMARRLTIAVGYEVTADEYRKYEGGKKPSSMPHDLLFPFAEITGRTVGTLVAPLPFRVVRPEQALAVRPAPLRKPAY